MCRLRAHTPLKLHVQISWQVQHFVNLHVQISWQVQHFVYLHVQISWQAQHFVHLHVQISWQAQHFVNLHAQISWQAQHLGSWKLRTGDFVHQKNSCHLDQRRIRSEQGRMKSYVCLLFCIFSHVFINFLHF